ncbi:GH32 C-terminal domain-containing protein [uncultured Prevotella sp.]|uniref:GH32 C-terminal domain-containing protein n=1 Tax=uncultured Prevotella sp. TaxID=159272 RepID=UPI002627032B|nr:GH32 C-terminal domain-containing protein [uncultured Prevotella sp.]
MFAAACLLPLSASAQDIKVTRSGDTTIVKITNPKKYLILPVEETKDESHVLLSTGSPADAWMDVRLARQKTDYCVPFALGNGKTATVKILNISPDALALKNLTMSDTWSVENTDYYRPLYHHTPSYGWMNDANGMVYKDGEYHLYFQYNPYGSKWGNMHWGHAVSTDLMHWKELQPAIARDTMGHIFSGSSVVDKNNTAGYGNGAIIALYTSASDKNGQIQCMAYSTDNGRTFTKYEGNPVLRPFDGLKDFRDPKVFWYEPAKAWYMIVSADKEMRFYKSDDLKKWTYISGFGRGYGMQPCQYECPDFVQLPVNGDKNNMKYVMLMNVNPGCLFGGSATEYFVGDFDGKNFICVDDPHVPKWLDYGKDHYATVCFSNTGDRVIALPWMSNWQYANVTPIKQYRGANGLPRELSLYTKDGRYYVAANIAPEVKAIRKETKTVEDIKTNASVDKKGVAAGYDGAFEIELDVTPAADGTAGIEVYNDKGEKTMIYFDLKQMRAVMDRTESGLTDFGKLAEPHDIEKKADAARLSKGQKPMRIENSVNYKNDFALGTWAPLNLCEDKTYHVDVFVDKCSVELFVDGGRIAMTNLVFPTKPYDSVKFYSEGGKSAFSQIKVYKLGM